MQVFSTPPILSYYSRRGPITSPGRHAAWLSDLPGDIAGLAAVLHGLIIHEHLAGRYGVTLSDRDRGSVHVRRAEDLLGLIIGRDASPLTVPREPAARLAGNCRHFTVLLVAMLRAQGTPARARCGFGGYFGTGLFEDHWVCEYWDASTQLWKLADAQIDARQREIFPIGFDVTDVPRDQFLIAGDAWAQCREGTADPADFGLSAIKESGLWWIAGNLMRDAAALANVELLPWDCWGAMPAPYAAIGPALARQFDQVLAVAGLARRQLKAVRAVDQHAASVPQERHERDRPNQGGRWIRLDRGEGQVTASARSTRRRDDPRPPPRLRRADRGSGPTSRSPWRRVPRPGARRAP